MGKLYGIGVGPGDPELLTLKAHRILNAADVIFCPEKEAGAGSFAFDIIQGLLEDTKAEIVNLVYPMHYHGTQLREMWKQNAGCIAHKWGPYRRLYYAGGSGGLQHIYVYPSLHRGSGRGGGGSARRHFLLRCG